MKGSATKLENESLDIGILDSCNYLSGDGAEILWIKTWQTWISQ